MKLVCLRDFAFNPNRDLYVNKDSIYEGDLTPTIYDKKSFEPLPKKYYIICNDGFGRVLEAEHFITLQEWREQQINEILN